MKKFALVTEEEREMLKANQDIPERNQDYERCGYRAGYLAGIEDYHALMLDKHYNRKEAFTACRKAYEGPMFRWQMTEMDDTISAPRAEDLPIKRIRAPF